VVGCRVVGGRIFEAVEDDRFLAEAGGERVTDDEAPWCLGFMGSRSNAGSRISRDSVYAFGCWVVSGHGHG
jgi:hypothetical protein